jgi:hypothetical protein
VPFATFNPLPNPFLKTGRQGTGHLPLPQNPVQRVIQIVLVVCLHRVIGALIAADSHRLLVSYAQTFI